jgi:membrane-associated protease RseP (regulator of RpoE activity)
VETVLLFVLGIVIFVLGLGVSIALHELGHLSFAKLFGVKVTQYMIGFGKTLFSFRRGETEYGLKAIPLGGYIAMTGMFPPRKPGEKARNSSTGFYNNIVQDARMASADTIEDGEEDRTFYRLAPWKRIIVMFAGPFANLVIAFVLIAIIVSGIGVQQPSTTVSAVSQCVVSASSAKDSCAASDPLSPAAAAGLKPGDEIVSFDGTPVTSWTELSSSIRKAAGSTVPIVVKRDGQDVTLQVSPVPTEEQVTAANGTTTTQKVGFIGITPTQPFTPQPVTEVLPTFGQNVGASAGIFISLPQRMVQVWNAAFGTEKRDSSGPIGLIGVGRLAGEVASDGAVPVVAKVNTMLGILASLNIALFLLNMVPLLPLDGGHIAGALWEWARRTVAKIAKRRDPGPFDMARFMPVTFVVIAVLGAMSLLLAYADIVKPVALPG